MDSSASFRMPRTESRTWRTACSRISRWTDATLPPIVTRHTIKAALGPEARAMCAGLVLRPGQPFHILDVGRYGVEQSPAIPHHDFVDQPGVRPHVRQNSAITIGRGNIGLE